MRSAARGPASLATPAPPLGLVDRMARRIVVSQLSDIRRGEINLQDGGRSVRLGQPDDLAVAIQVHRPRFFRQAVLGGTLSIAESYLQGDWDCEDLVGLFRIFARNQASANRVDGSLAWVASLGHRWLHAWRANTRAGSRKNIAAHYDLGNDFYRLWLDDTLAYSSGMFAAPQSSMREASVEKFDRVCRKLELKPSDEVVEIGTGWGGFALHAARHYGSRMTTTTISREQGQLARERIAAAGLEDRITLLDKDYRELRGQYDKLVSIEMIEAVGQRYFDQYFRACSQLLRADGSMLLQAIVMPEQGYARYLKSVDFIQRYVFPGGCLPSLGAMLDSVGRSTDLRLVHVEDFAPHYAETLRRWRQAFHAGVEEVRGQGYSEEFVRLWNYYLCYCEAAFEERCIGVLQIQLDKPQCRRDPLRISNLAARHTGAVPHCIAVDSAKEGVFL